MKISPSDFSEGDFRVKFRVKFFEKILFLLQK